MSNLLEPVEVTIQTRKHGEKKYWLSSFPAIAGREIVSGYPLTALPKIGDYKTNEQIMFKLMSYVAVEIAPGNFQKLSTPALIDNHVPDFEALIKLEIEMMKHNTSFFDKGEISNFFQESVKKLLGLISPTLMDSSAQLLAQVKQRLKNSEKTTP